MSRQASWRRKVDVDDNFGPSDRNFKQGRFLLLLRDFICRCDRRRWFGDDCRRRSLLASSV